jgi:hypothetical protein
MRAILAGAAQAAFVVTPTLADYYIVQEPTTKRCRIVEERPAPGGRGDHRRRRIRRSHRS